jgi:phenylalanyl-tRNA synthetase beta chain
VYRLLGIELAPERIARHLELLGCTIEDDGAEMLVRPPAWRSDLAISADLVEEVARMEGYDEIPSVEPSVPAHAISSAQYRFEDQVASELAQLEYNEISTLALQGTHVLSALERSGLPLNQTLVHVRNPMSDEQRILRWSLGFGLLDHLARLDQPYHAFEIGHTFVMYDGTINETPSLTFGFTAEPLDEPAWRDTHFLKLKGDCEALLRAIAGIRLDYAPDNRSGWHPGKTAAALWNGREVATLGKVDPRLAAAFDVRLPVYLCNMHLENVPEYQRPLYRPPSRFPSTYRDLAVVVDLDVSAERIAQVVREAIGPLCTSVHVFDEYRGRQVGEARKSLAVRATMQHFDSTITDDEADAAMQRAIDALARTLQGTIRQ